MKPNSYLRTINSVRSLEDLARIINDNADYPTEIVNAVILQNGWEDISDEIWGIAFDPKTGTKLMFDDHAIAIVE